MNTVYVTTSDCRLNHEFSPESREALEGRCVTTVTSKD